MWQTTLAYPPLPVQYWLVLNRLFKPKKDYIYFIKLLYRGNEVINVKLLRQCLVATVTLMISPFLTLKIFSLLEIIPRRLADYFRVRNSIRKVYEENSRPGPKLPLLPQPLPWALLPTWPSQGRHLTEGSLATDRAVTRAMAQHKMS